MGSISSQTASESVVVFLIKTDIPFCHLFQIIPPVKMVQIVNGRAKWNMKPWDPLLRPSLDEMKQEIEEFLS